MNTPFPYNLHTLSNKQVITLQQTGCYLDLTPNSHKCFKGRFVGAQTRIKNKILELKDEQ